MAATASILGTALLGSAASAGAAGTAGLIGFGGALSTMGVISAAASGLGIISSIAGMSSQKGEARQAAYDESVSAKNAKLRGEQEANRIRRALIRDVSSATARAGQAGIGPTLLNQQVAGIESEGADELNASKFNTDMEVRRRRAQSAIYRRSGRTSILDYAGPIASGTTQLATAAMAR